MTPWVLALLLHGAAPSAPAELRVCIANLAYPPSITLDPRHPGTRERQFVESGHSVGLRVSLHYWPIRRCKRMVQEGELDALYLAATPGHLSDYRFPRDAKGQLDRGLRIADEAVILVRRKGAGPQWDGQRFSAPPRLGTRASLQMALEAARLRGLGIDESAFDAAQVLRQLGAGRHDYAVLLRADVRDKQALLDELGLEVLAQPLASFDGFMAVSPKWPASRQFLVQAWWQALPHWQP